MSNEKKRASGKGVTNLSHVVDSYLKSLGAYLALTAAIERGGYDVSPCLICGEPVVCIPDGLAMCKDCATVSDEPSKAAEETWHYEDNLPSGYDYESNFDRSKVVDGVRMFPAIPKTSKEG